MKKRNYIKPEVIKVVLDNIISLQMQSDETSPPVQAPITPRGGSNPEKSPFGNSPFS